MRGPNFSNGNGFKPFQTGSGRRVTKINTPLRVVFTLAGYFILAQTAYAQTVLNFAKATLNERLSPGFAVVNPTSNYVDVQFTYYGLDGNPVSTGLVNPVRHRVAPKGQISIKATELFQGSRADGWVQVTSPASGLTGFYLSGDFATTLEGADPASAWFVQVVPVIRDDSMNKTELVILNPGVASTNIAVTLYNTRGEQVGNVPAQVIAGHGSLRLSSATMNLGGAGTFSAKITSSSPVAATAIVDRGDSLVFVNGQSVEQASALRIAPDFVTAGGFDPVLVLANPSTSQVTVRVTVHSENGGFVLPELANSRTFTIPANGLRSADIREITGQPIGPTVNGWLRVESPNVPLAGVVILDHSSAVTAMPLQTAPSDQMIVPRLAETAGMFTGLSLVNPSSADASVDVTAVRGDGTTLAHDVVTIPANSKSMNLLRDLLPGVDETSAYLVIRSSTPLYGTGMLADAVNNSFLAMVPLARITDGFAPSPVPMLPSIVSIEPGTNVQPGASLRISLSSPLSEPTFTIAGQIVNARQLGPISPSYELIVPAIEPGFANLKVSNNGLESAPVRLRLLANDSVPTQVISGAAFYQKIDVSDAGLELGRPVMVPVRNARVEVFSRSAQTLVAVSETDLRGRFSVPVPLDPNLTVRVLSRLRSYDLRVEDNTNQSQLYWISADIDGRVARSDVLLADSSRLSGAFNLLEMIQRSNDIMVIADPGLAPPPLKIFWSTRNRKGDGAINIAQGLIGTTYFNVSNNTAYVVGDRNEDSDEFDDAVIIHEYAHLLAVKFSRDDSPGGRHSLGDMLDPRVAWSEGWANFFASVVRNDPIWRDSSGPNGASLALRYDLEENVPAGDRPGYWSEASVGTILWDLFDDHPDAADDVKFSFAQIWSAFVDLRGEQFVYLPYFLEHFLTRYPYTADLIRMIVQSRSIDFQPNVRPSVAYPFPTPMNVGTPVSGIVDSVSTRRNNLVTSSHFYSFTTSGGSASIRLDITGLGPGENPNSNDLDLFLMDDNGRILDRSDNGLNGQSERIVVQKLPAGTYVLEIRSYYTRAETGGFVFNSGQYRLNVSIQ